MNAPDRLSEGLRKLGRAAPAPSPALETRLRHEFRRHHARRRRVRFVGALAALLLAASPLLLQHRLNRQPAARATQEPAAGGSAVLASASLDRGWSALEAGDFVALPSYDPAIPVEGARLVRLQMPGSALRLVGMPVRQDAADRQFLADVLLAQDGTPFAVRLVNE